MISDLKHSIKLILINNKKGILLVGVYIAMSQAMFSYICPSMWLLGLPCPACGLTRAGISLLRLDFSGAINYNPSIFLVPFAIYAYIKRHAAIFALIIVIMFAIFVVRVMTSFGVEPLIINRNALMFRVIELF